MAVVAAAENKLCTDTRTYIYHDLASEQRKIFNDDPQRAFTALIGDERTQHRHSIRVSVSNQYELANFIPQ